MKKKIILLVLGSILMFPWNVWGKEKEYSSLGLKETCESEGILFSHPNYQEQEGKANIYLFRGSGCEHCYQFLTYLEAITEKYGETFNLISYEVWQNENNYQLMEKVSKKLGEKANGVPYIVIGKHFWAGYSESLNEEIFQAIEEEYQNKNKNDIVSKIIQEEGTLKSIDFIIPISFLFLIFLLFYARNKTKI